MCGRGQGPRAEVRTVSEEVCASRLQRERAKVSVLEQLIEDQTRRLFLANADLRRRQEHLETVYRVIPGAILVFDDADRVELANEACEELFGGAPEGIPIDEFTHEPLPPLDSSDRREIDLCRLDGSIVPVMLSRRRWSDGPGQVWVAIDLTDQRRMEADLRQSQKLQSIGTLAAGVAHELNTPIQYIQDNIGFVAQATENLFGLLTAARDRLPDEEAKAKFDDDCARMDLDFFREELPDALSALRFGAERMKTIVAAMKSLSHPQPAQMAYYDINRGIRDVAVIASSEYKYVAKLELELGELPRVKCRADDLNTVFLNMIVNAAHAIKDANRGLGPHSGIDARVARTR